MLCMRLTILPRIRQYVYIPEQTGHGGWDLLGFVVPVWTVGQLVPDLGCLRLIYIGT